MNRQKMYLKRNRMKKSQKRKMKREVPSYLIIIYRNFPGIYALGNGISTFKKKNIFCDLSRAQKIL